MGMWIWSLVHRAAEAISWEERVAKRRGENKKKKKPEKILR